MGIPITVKTHTKIRSHIKNPSFDGYSDNRLKPIKRLGHTFDLNSIVLLLNGYFQQMLKKRPYKN